MKEELYRVHIIVGGDKLDYNDDVGSLVTNLLEIKILINSIISNTQWGAIFMYADIKDYFLATLIKDPEYMRVKY